MGQLSRQHSAIWSPRGALSVALVSLSGLLGTNCGPNCQSTCNRLYQPSECNIQSPGQSTEELLLKCLNECEDGLQVPGEIRAEYTPNEYTPSDDPIIFTNDEEVALWMECIAETSCELISTGYCAPVW